MEHVLSNVNKIVIDPSASKSGVVPYLPLTESGATARPAQPQQGGNR
jgi:hypothetical protein